MIARWHPLALVALALLVVGCASRPADGPALSVPFRNRWWHFYERGLAWADAGDDARAEADLRQCLRLRRTDSRLARTYGMHFVQCFAHRELGAVLLRRGELDAAERELRASLAQEPSAKAEFLLQQIAERRAGRAAAAPAVPAPSARLEVASIVPAADAGLLRVSGRLAGGGSLWAEQAAAPPQRLALAADGAFSAELPPDTLLRPGTADAPDPGAPAVSAVVVAAPALHLDGPDDGMVVADGQAWFRWRAEAAGGLATLTVEDAAGLPLASLPLTGLAAAGTLRLDLPAGVRELRFALTDSAGGGVTATRTVEARSTPAQDRSLRATALAIPLLAPRPSAMRPGDDPRLVSALLADGRFRLLDQRADALLARELTLAEAGLIDRATAAAAGRRLACRYVIAGTVTRTERDAECFLRLVHCGSGRVVASADAYAPLSAAGDAEALFAASAGRLRQVFPVVAGGCSVATDGLVRLDLGRRSGVTALMRVHVFPAPPGAGTPVGELEVVEVGEDAATARPTGGTPPAAGWGVSE